MLWTFYWTLDITAISVGAATITANSAVTALVLPSSAYRLVLSNTAAQDNLMQTETEYKVRSSFDSCNLRARFCGPRHAAWPWSLTKQLSSDPLSPWLGANCAPHEMQMAKRLYILAKQQAVPQAVPQAPAAALERLEPQEAQSTRDSEAEPTSPRATTRLAAAARSHKELLAAVPAVQELSETELTKILQYVTVREFKDKEVIIEEGSAGKDMFIIQSGDAVCTKEGVNHGDWPYSCIDFV